MAVQVPQRRRVSTEMHFGIVQHIKETVDGHFGITSLAMKVTSAKRFVLDVPDVVQLLMEFHAEEMHCKPEVTSPEDVIDFFHKAKDLHMGIICDENLTCCPSSDGDKHMITISLLTIIS